MESLASQEIRYNITRYGRRSATRAYLLMTGMSGAGKSTTLNALYDPNAKRGEDDVFCSITQHVIEYRVPVSSAHNGLPAKEIIITDTPGFHDVNEANPRVKDATIMSTIQSYLNNHDELSECYPTAVLLVVNFSDIQLYDENEPSYFVEFLQALQELIDNYILIDTGTKTCNLILVLTHFTTTKISVTEAEYRIRFLLALIKAYTKIPSGYPVVLAENKGIDYQLLQIDGQSKLPNGELYPENLFRAIYNLAFQNQDKLGASIISEVFSDPFRFRKREVTRLSLVDAEHSLAKRYFYNFDTLRCSIHRNEISRQFQEIWQQLSKTERENKKQLLRIVIAIFARENITTLDHLPNSDNDVIRLLDYLPFPNPVLEKVVRGIGVEPPRIWRCANDIGRFYNILDDNVKNVSRFKVSDMYITSTGHDAQLHVHAGLVTNVEKKIFTSLQTFPTKESYISKRWKSIGVNFTDKKLRAFNPEKVLPGNIISYTNKCPEKISAIKEYRLYYVMLTNKYTLDQAYIQDLPRYSTRASPVIWANHFANYGSYVLSFAYVGGCVKVEAERDISSLHVAMPEVVKNTIQTIFEEIGKSINYNGYRDAHGWSFKISYIGGSSEAETSTPKMPHQVFCSRGVQEFESWMQALNYYPVLLKTDIKLTHVANILKSYYPALSEQVLRNDN